MWFSRPNGGSYSGVARQGSRGQRLPPPEDWETTSALQSLQGAILEDSGPPWPVGGGHCRPQAPSLCPLGLAPSCAWSQRCCLKPKGKLRPPAQPPWTPPWPTVTKACSAQAAGCHPLPPSQLPSAPSLLRPPHPVAQRQLTSGGAPPAPALPPAPIGSVPSREARSRQQSWETFFTTFK